MGNFSLIFGRTKTTLFKEGNKVNQEGLPVSQQQLGNSGDKIPLVKFFYELNIQLKNQNR